MKCSRNANGRRLLLNGLTLEQIFTDKRANNANSGTFFFFTFLVLFYNRRNQFLDVNKREKKKLEKAEKESEAQK